MVKNWNDAHSVWGPTLDQYLGESPRDQVSTVRANRHQISEAFEMLIEGYPTCATFELLLSLPDRPKLVQHFLGYDNKDLIPGCVGLLQEYCESNAIFDHAYGLLCLQTLVLLLEVALVQCLELCIWKDIDTRISHRRFAELLSQSLTQRVANSDLSAPSLGKPYLQDLHWVEPNDSNSLTGLSTLGRLTWNQLAFVICTIFKSSGPLQNVLCTSEIPGFSALLFLFWQYAVYQDSDRASFSNLLDLTIRYWPYASSTEHDLLSTMFEWARLQIIELGQVPEFNSAGAPDAFALIDRYINILPKPARKGGLLTLNDAASMVEVFYTAPIVYVPGRIAPLALVSLDRCWAELDTQMLDTKDVEAILRLFRAALRIPLRVRAHERPVVPHLLGYLAIRLDFISLVGRLVLVGLGSFAARPLASIFQTIEKLFRFMTYSYSIAVRTRFRSSHSDWLKVFDWLDLGWQSWLNSGCCSDEHLEDSVLDCYNAWVDLGDKTGVCAKDQTDSMHLPSLLRRVG